LPEATIEITLLPEIPNLDLINGIQRICYEVYLKIKAPKRRGLIS